VANARTRYDTLSEYLVRNHEATHGTLFGKPCLVHRDEAFMQIAPGGVAFRLHGRAYAGALALPGARTYDPNEPANTAAARPGWVLVPSMRFLAWEPLAHAAIACVDAARLGQVTWGARGEANGADAPASSSESLAERATKALEKGFDFKVER